MGAWRHIAIASVALAAVFIFAAVLGFAIGGQ
jgi:hypothetical protein